MAKRYFEFNRLREITPNEPHRFPGLLGLHHIVILKSSDDTITVAGVTSCGKSETVSLRPGDTLGYNCGEVWVLPNPDHIKDPLKKVCRVTKFPLNKVIFAKLDEMAKFHDDLDGGAIAPGYVPFYNGVTYDRFTTPTGKKFMVETTWRKVGPIDQRKYTTAFFFEEGTTRNEAASVIEEWRTDKEHTFSVGW